MFVETPRMEWKNKINMEIANLKAKIMWKDAWRTMSFRWFFSWRAYKMMYTLNQLIHIRNKKSEFSLTQTQNELNLEEIYIFIIKRMN